MKGKIIAFVFSIALCMCVFSPVTAFAGDKGRSGGESGLATVNLPTGGIGSEIVEHALSRLGDPYSLELRGQGDYIDCSGLTQWAYECAGVNIPWTAAEQARSAVDGNRVVDAEDAAPGDLIFWSYPDKARVQDRYMQIGHAAIYAGDGMMVESSPSAGGVVYREVSVQGTPSFYARLYD